MRLPSLPEGKHELMIPTPYYRFLEQLRGQQKAGKIRKKALIIYLVTVAGICGLYSLIGHSFPHSHTYALIGPLFNLCLAFIGAGWIYKFLFAPKHLQVGTQGMRFHWLSATFLYSSDWIDWNAIQSVGMATTKFGYTQVSLESIDIEIDLTKVSNSAWRALVFMSPMYWRKRGFKAYTFSLYPQVLSLDNDRQNVIAAFKTFLPSEKIDTSLAAFEAEDIPSYTRIWLNELSSAQGTGNQLDPLLAGHILYDGKYRIVERIAAGGQAITYKAEDQEQHTVALKEFVMPTRGGLEIKRRALENVEHEAQLLKKIDHDQIVKLLDFFVEAQRAYLALEYIDGQSLRKIVQAKGPFAEAEVLRMAQGMSDILQYLHQQKPPIVHRDFTPDNLLLSSQGKLVLIDFNVAEQLELQMSKGVAGKHSYIPPEQFRGEATAQSDIYAMGATMHYLLTGHDPEPISTSHPIAINAKISEAIDAIVARATAIKLDQRYQDSAAIKADLEVMAKGPSSTS
jgi:tRNA A-37 threonylcarbamoyl transferase component Bud32